tara:strand:- start:28163 stop:28366 length:204 start_codon:yes stop_codon:yes gene_type:complete
MSGVVYTPSMPMIAFGSTQAQFKNETQSSNNVLVSSHFPVYETAIFTSGIFLGILITLSMMTIFKRG